MGSKRPFRYCPYCGHPTLEATVTDVTVHRRRPPADPTVTVTFTVGEDGKPPGTGLPAGRGTAAFSVHLVSKTGVSGNLIEAKGRDGRYSATTLLPAGGVGSIQVGGWLDIPTGAPTAAGGFWIPTAIATNNY